MKQIYIWVTALSLITGCIGENGGNEKTSQMILGIVNQQSKISINDDRKSSDLIIQIPTFYVDSISGNDSTNPGTKSAPFRTITKAILALKNSSIKVIAVAPGTYDATIGETFPITIPEGVNIYGDINGKGLIGGASSLYAGPPGTTPKTGVTLISGNGADSVSNRDNVTLTLRNSSQISGFKITNPRPYDSQRLSVIVLLNAINSAKVHKNTIEGVMGGHGIIIDSNNYEATLQGGNVISGNSIYSNLTGINDFTSSASKVNKVENNIITKNNIGINSEHIRLDLGQGSTGSVGGNVFSCNDHQDLYLSSSTAVTLYALSNAWDHMPPTVWDHYSGSGTDIVNSNNALLIYFAGGSVAPEACN
ncbi:MULTISPECIES: DUF1565 domain-containing protein [Leptospira]|uniref:LIC10774 family surface protein n=1 Tax=Leptospira TaxID=171 RepID=UPI0002BFC25D|nr:MULTISPECIES: DUF1565 domain-containing protein [Leptospira]EMJ66264.1 PF07602 family protein [Leptospira sp. P2653]EMN42754.1 PF07602 family protein [Leptospira weilii str. LNT 1234]